MDKKREKLFFDTNEIVGCSYNFDSGILDALKLYTERGFVKLVTSSVVVKEIKKHIEADAKEGYRQLLSVMKKYKITTYCNSSFYGELFKNLKNIDENAFIKDLENRFDQYMAETDCEVLGTQSVNLDGILEDHFSLNPPFEEKKKYEFKDAIIVETIKQYMKSNRDETLYVASKDVGFKSALTTVERVKLVDDIQEFLNCFNREYEKETTEAIKKYIRVGSKKTKLLSEIEDIIRLADYDLYEEYDELYVTDTKDVKYNVIAVTGIDSINENAAILLECKAEIDILYTQIDEENSIWDFEEKEYFYEHYARFNESHRIHFKLPVALSVVEGTKLMISIDEVNPDDMDIKIKLDKSTIII